MISPAGFPTWALATEIYSLRVYDRVLPIEKDSIVLDVGAAIGTFAMYAARKVGPNGLVYAIEPDQRNFEVLTANITEQQNIIPVNVAAWNENCLLPFQSESNAGSHISPTGESIVQGRRLDDLIQEQTIGFVKIDVEGSAHQVLEGLERIMPRIQNIAIAAYHSTESPQLLVQYLKDRGFYTTYWGEFSKHGQPSYVYATRSSKVAQAFEPNSDYIIIGSIMFGVALYLIWRHKR